MRPDPAGSARCRPALSKVGAVHPGRSRRANPRAARQRVLRTRPGNGAAEAYTAGHEAGKSPCPASRRCFELLCSKLYRRHWHVCYRLARTNLLTSGDRAGRGEQALEAKWSLMGGRGGVACRQSCRQPRARATRTLPDELAGQQGIVFQGGSCTNAVTGAYSNAALASQSLGELSELSSQDATNAAMASISGRRTAEEQRCPDGFTRRQRRLPAGNIRVSLRSRGAARRGLDFDADRIAGVRGNETDPRKSAVAEPTARLAVWAQTYGDYERDTGQSPGSGEFSVLALDARSTTWSGGVLGGVDYTFRDMAVGGDGLIVGVLAGQESSHVSLRTASLSSDPTSPNGFSTMKAVLTGPATGVYASYFDGGFSTDLAFKVEFFNLNLSFSDLLGFQSAPGFPPTSVPFSGGGATSVDNYTTSGNVNYRFPVKRKRLDRADRRISIYPFALCLRRRRLGSRGRFRPAAAGGRAFRARG